MPDTTAADVGQLATSLRAILPAGLSPDTVTEAVLVADAYAIARGAVMQAQLEITWADNTQLREQNNSMTLALQAERERTARLVQLANGILQAFTKTSDGYRARAGGVQIRKWEAALLELK